MVVGGAPLIDIDSALMHPKSWPSRCSRSGFASRAALTSAPPRVFASVWLAPAERIGGRAPEHTPL